LWLVAASRVLARRAVRSFDTFVASVGAAIISVRIRKSRLQVSGSRSLFSSLGLLLGRLHLTRLRHLSLSVGRVDSWSTLSLHQVAIVQVWGRSATVGRCGLTLLALGRSNFGVRVANNVAVVLVSRVVVLAIVQA